MPDLGSDIPPIPAGVELPSGSMESVLSEVRDLMGLSAKYLIDVSIPNTDVAKASRFWKLNDAANAHASIAKALDGLKGALDSYARRQMESIRSTLDKLGPFAPPDARSSVALIETLLARRQYPQLLNELDALGHSLKDFEEMLGPTGKFLSALKAINSGITSLGGMPPSTETVIEKAYAAFEKGQPMVAEAGLGLAVSDSLEALAPLLANRISVLSGNVRKAHEKGKDTREAALILKQVIIALRARNYLQVLGLIHRLESKIPPDIAVGGDAAESDARPRRRIKGRSTSPAEGGGGSESSSRGKEFPEIQRGRNYLFQEEHPEWTLRAFLEAKGAQRGLFLTATFPPKIQERVPLPATDLVWMSETEGWTETYHPKTLDHEVSARILNFVRGEGAGAVAIEGLGQLVSSNGVDRVEKFLKLVLDVASAKRVSVIARLPPEMEQEKGIAKIRALFDETV